MFREFREVETNIEREKNLSVQNSDESQNYRKIKPKGNITVEQANAFWANKFAQEAEERRKTSSEVITLFDIFNVK